MLRKGLSKLKQFKDVLDNRVVSVQNGSYTHLFYIVETADWAVKWIGYYVTSNLQSLGLLPAHTTTTFYGIRNQIIHFGAKQDYLLSGNWKKVHKSNKVVFSWFHGGKVVSDPLTQKMIVALPEASKRASLVHTSCKISKARLVEYGLPEEKVVLVPLGVDLRRFKPVDTQRKQILREKIGIPAEHVCIGSFQKDGAGWGEGLEPKWVKGPDVFVKVVEKLKKDYDIFILLLGPARGYVKRELDKRGIPYKHIFLKNYLEIPKYYNALDLYLVTSREEGGPFAVLEAMASGIPLVSTKVGMAVDVINDGYNGLLADVDDVEMLTENARDILDDENFAKKMVENGLKVVRDYSWEEITKRYYEEIYSPLVEEAI